MHNNVESPGALGGEWGLVLCGFTTGEALLCLQYSTASALLTFKFIFGAGIVGTTALGREHIGLTMA